jgi:peptidoglycan/LPS O-acetylase OafA/YrhL
MIQRIQTVFLLLAMVMQGLLFKVNLYTAGISAEDEIQYNAWQHENITSKEIHVNILHIALQFALMGITLYTIFKFKQRKVQMKLCWYLVLGSAISFLLGAFNVINSNYTTFHFGFGAYIITIAIVLYICSYFFIRRDEELVRSADRIR